MRARTHTHTHQTHKHTPRYERFWCAPPPPPPSSHPKFAAAAEQSGIGSVYTAATNNTMAGGSSGSHWTRRTFDLRHLPYSALHKIAASRVAEGLLDPERRAERVRAATYGALWCVCGV